MADDRPRSRRRRIAGQQRGAFHLLRRRWPARQRLDAARQLPRAQDAEIGSRAIRVAVRVPAPWDIPIDSSHR
jgi:hypothetical protein